MGNHQIIFNKNKDIVQIIAPASKCNALDDVLINATRLLKDNHIKFRVAEDLFSDSSLPFYSNSLEYRFNDIKNALDDGDVKIIWCIRAGYGSAEVAQLLEGYSLKQPKILIGFSDITSLHLLFNNEFQMPSIHGPNIHDLSSNSLQIVLDMLQGKQYDYKLIQISSTGYKPIKGSSVIGGNLTVLCSNIGVFNKSFFDNKILLLEDVNEYSYAIKRSLMQLYRNDMLKNLKAIIFGDFTKSDKYLDRTLAFFTDSYCSHIPVFTTPNIGHGDLNYPIIFSSRADIIDGNLCVYSPYQMVN